MERDSRTVLRNNPQARRRWKFQIVKGLYEHGLQRQDIVELFRVIDWMMELPADLSIQFVNDMAEFEKGKNMRYVTSIERHAIERGREEGRHAGLLEAVGLSLEFKFGNAAQPLLDSLREIKDVELLREVQQAVVSGAKLTDLKKLLEKSRS